MHRDRALGVGHAMTSALSVSSDAELDQPTLVAAPADGSGRAIDPRHVTLP